MAEYQETITGGPGSWNQTSSFTSSPGTLASRGLYRNIAPPRNSQAQGIQGTDERAYTRQVGSNELVSDQMRGLLSQQSPYMRLAEQGAQRQAMSRGLGNSSIAAGAGRRAAIESAMPIAQADAATYGRTQAENMEALNRGLMQERDIANQQSLESSRLNQAGMNAGLQAQIARMGFDADLQRQREDLAFRGEQQGLDRFQQQQMAQFGLGADLMRGTQQYGFQRGLNEQGYQFDLGRMGAQDYYNSQQGQRDMQNQAILAEYGVGLGVMTNFYNEYISNFFAEPEVFMDPYVQQAVVNFGGQFRPNFMGIFNNIYGRG